MPEWFSEVARLGTDLAIVIVFITYLHRRDKEIGQISVRCHTTSENGHIVLRDLTEAQAKVISAVNELKTALHLRGLK